MSDRTKRTTATRVSIDNALSFDARTVLADLKSDITRCVKTGAGIEGVENSIGALDIDPFRRKGVAPVNQYTDNVTYVDHTPYSDGYADTYNDGRCQLKQGS